MGNRAVITTPTRGDVAKSNNLGIYLHWNGGRDSVNAFLTYCKIKGISKNGDYCFARLVQVIANFFGGTDTIGVDICRRLDCNNYDNGVYFIKNLEIVGRAYNTQPEQNEYDLLEFLLEIDKKQPDKLGKRKIKEYLTHYVRSGNI